MVRQLELLLNSLEEVIVRVGKSILAKDWKYILLYSNPPFMICVCFD